jgi:hypothetical protein
MRHNQTMHALFPFVLFGSIALFVLLGVISTFTRSSNLYDQIGQGGLSVSEDQLGSPPGAAPRGSTEVSERELEIRQMLQARSDRLVDQGRAPLDIDAELAKLEPASAPGAPYQDAAVAAEVRQLVVARNERRIRQGQPALDVEFEVARTLAELQP